MEFYKPKTIQPPLVIFDGLCNFCDASVNFILKKDHRQYFLFSPNQEGKGYEILNDHAIDSQEVNTLYLYENGKLYDRSTAALRISRRLVFPWNLCYGLIVVPKFIRDFIYAFIAKNRYKWFGKKESCRIPTSDERGRFV